MTNDRSRTLFDTSWYENPELRKFKGKNAHVNAHQHTYADFNEAKNVVVKKLELELERLKKELDKTKSLKGPGDLEFSKNPFD